MPKLKVFVTPIGFHDAYVAATSQKAALQAWGADVDLFARGAASLVTDTKLAEEPLASPGKVIKRLRGSEAEQIAAAERSTRPAKARPRAMAEPHRDEAKPATRQKPKAAPALRAKAPPRPSRKALASAEAALAAAETRQREAQRAIADRIADLQRERQELRAAADKEIARLERRRDDARSRYQDAVERWASR